MDPGVIEREQRSIERETEERSQILDCIGAAQRFDLKIFIVELIKNLIL